MHFVTKYLSGLKRTVSADNRAPLIIYHQGGEEGEWRILGGGEDLMVSGRRGGVLTRKSQKSVYHDNQFLPTGYLADGL